MSEVTVFCAVWNKDPNRHALLKAHRENLRRQSVSVRAVYVFDDGDAPPPGLEAQTLVSGEALSIYQAWNLALAAVTTPLVMNLNLDDRLAPDAIEKLSAHLQQTGAVLAGGDWRICLSQDETDAVQPCGAASDVAFSLDCPPAMKPSHRLGSGTGERQTYGPATLWRTNAHVQVPRYSWRLNDGSLIRSVGDGLFWALLSRLGGTLSRLPLVIGNYHFHPQDQAEYRVSENLTEIFPKVMKV